MYIYNLYLLSFISMLYRSPVDTSPVTEGVTLFKHQLLLLLLDAILNRFVLREFPNMGKN